jgi:vancomycin resistance protein VanJ
LLTAIHFIAPQRGGALALTQIVSPHLFAVLAFLVPLAFVRDARLLRVVLAIALLVGAVRFGDGVVSLPAADVPDSERIAVMSWNLKRGRAADLARVIRDSDARIVALQEVTPEAAQALEADPAVAQRYPYRRFLADPGVTGLGLLSAYEITTTEAAPGLAQRVTVTVPNAGALRVVNAHPLPGAIATATVLRIPLDFDPSRRDADIAKIRSWIDDALRAGERVVALGDYNVTDREPAYATLSAGLHDAHRAVGVGFGSSWRPDRFETLPLGLLRIDYALSGPGATPIALATDCTPRGSDHCILRATFALLRSGAAADGG